MSLTLDQLVGDVAVVYPGGPGDGWHGSGRLIAPGLILTAGHVVDSGKPEPPMLTGWKVLLLREQKQDGTWGKPHDAKVVWRGLNDLDLALLQLIDDGDRTAQLMPGLTPIFVSYDQVEPVAQVYATGFPEAWRTAKKTRDFTVPGSLLIPTRHGPFVWIAAITPDERSDWKGMSGASVCNIGPDDKLCLFGVVREVPACFSHGPLEVARVSKAFEDDKFSAQLQTALGGGFRGPVYYEFSTAQKLREKILRIDEMREPVQPRVAHIPFLPMGERFIGRRQLLKSLREQLTARRAYEIFQPIALQADGGVGKTALAVELGWLLFEARQFDFVLLLNASTPQMLQSQLASLAGLNVLNLRGQNLKKWGEEEGPRRDAVLHWLGIPENAKRTMLILDNADLPEARQAVRELLPRVVACSILITTRYGDEFGGARKQELALFTAEEAREYLRKRLDVRLLATSSGEAELDAVAKELDHFPLALELAVNRMNKYRLTIAQWLTEWQFDTAAMMSFLASDASNYPVPLARVWEKSASHLSEKARELLQFFAWMEPRPSVLPRALFEAADNEALAELSELSMINWSAGPDEISIHRVLQAVLRHNMSEKDNTLSLEDAVKRIASPAWFNARRAAPEGIFLYATDLRNLEERLRENSKTKGDPLIGLRIRCAVVSATLRSLIRSSPASLEPVVQGPQSPATVIRRYKELPPLERIAALIKALEQDWHSEERAALFDDALTAASEGQKVEGFRMLLKIANDSENKQARERMRDTVLQIATPAERYLECLGAIDLVSDADKESLARAALESAASSIWDRLDQFLVIADTIASFPAQYQADAMNLARETVTKLTDKEIDSLLYLLKETSTSTELFDQVLRDLIRRKLKPSAGHLGYLAGKISSDLIPQALDLARGGLDHYSAWFFEVLAPRLTNEQWPKCLEIVAEIPGILHRRFALHALGRFVPGEFSTEFRRAAATTNFLYDIYKAEWQLALKLSDADDRAKALRDLRAQVLAIPAERFGGERPDILREFDRPIEEMVKI